MLCDECLGDPVLSVIRILIFVDQDEFEAIADFFVDIRASFEQERCFHQEVVEIEGVSFVE